MEAGVVMSRQDEHFDAMLLHLGAAYYQAVQGDGSASEVERALESVKNARKSSGAVDDELADGARARSHRGGRWRVHDVMSTDVVTVARTTSYKQVARLMTEHKVNALPVVDKNDHVIGMVSEADVLRKEERRFRWLVSGLSVRGRRERAKAEAQSAAELMTSPVVTTHPDASLASAARLMNDHHIRRLPVLDASGKLIGMVSRRDLLRVFLRPDAEIGAEVHGVLTGVLLEDPQSVTVQVRDGVVTLRGSISKPELIPAAVRLAGDVDGVVSVVSELTSSPEESAPGPAAHHD
jgi:CBS-domain-containing membrane protein